MKTTVGAGEDSRNPMGTTQYLRLWIDHPKFGCGWRHYAVLVGRKWVKVVEVASGKSATITKADFEIAARKGTPVTGKNPKRRLKRNAALFGHEKTAAVRDALARA